MGKTSLALFAAIASSTASASFSYSDFSDVSDFQLNGTAHQVGNVVRMTDDLINDQAGNMWHVTQQGVGGGFTTAFQFRCDGTGSAPADGMAFGIQADGPGALGNGGGDNAMIGINGSVVVNFQSFWNSVQIVAVDASGGSVYFDQVAFNGLHRPEPWTAQVSYDAVTHDWTVSLDGSLVIAANFAMADVVSLVGGTDAYVGLGAGTGLGFDNNDALSWNLEVVPEPATVLGLSVAILAVLRRRPKP